MLIRDLPTKRVLVRRGQKVYWQRYHYRERPTRIPDEEFSRAVEEALDEGFLRDSEGESILAKHQRWMVNDPQWVRIPPFVVIPEAMRDWERAKAKALKSGSLWAFPMQLHLSDEYLRRILAGNTLPQARMMRNWDDAIARLVLLYTYSSPQEAWQFLKRLGVAVLRRRKPMESNKGWEWLSLNRFTLSRMLFYHKHIPTYALPKKYSPHRAFIKFDYRPIWDYASEWFPLLVDINARQIAWQLGEAQKSGIKQEQLIRLDYASSLSLPPVSSRVRQYLERQGLLLYYEAVFEALKANHSVEFEQGETVYHQFLAALGS